MAKGHVIGNDEKVLIVTVWNKLKEKSPDVEAKDVLNAVSKHLFDKYGYCPKLRAVQDIIKKAKQSPHSPQDEYWNLGTTNTFPVNDDVIPMLLFLEASEINDKPVKTMTIRLAKWVSRLFPFFTQQGIVTGRGTEKELLNEWRNMVFICQTYETKERSCEEAGVPFDTYEYDLKLLKKDFEFFEAEPWKIINADLDKLSKKQKDGE